MGFGKKIVGSGTTIKTGKSNDFINNVANAVSINAGDGENTITNGFCEKNFEEISRLALDSQIELAEYILDAADKVASTVHSGEEVTIISGEDEDLIVNVSSYCEIYSGAGADKIISSNGEYNIINGEGDNDRIIVHHDVKSLILGGDGNDQIEVTRFTTEDLKKFIFQEVAKIIGGKIEDKARNRIKDAILEGAVDIGLTDNPYVFVGAFLFEQGWDKIRAIVNFFNKILTPFKIRQDLIDEFLSGESTVVGGKGDDLIICDGMANRNIYYSDGDGKDTIKGFTTSAWTQLLANVLITDVPLSTLHIESGEIESVTVEGNDVILKIGEGSITLEDGVNQTFNLKESDGTLTTRAYGHNDEDMFYLYKEGTMYFGNGGDDTIYGTDTIYGGDGNDKIYADTGKDYIDGGFGNDFIESKAWDSTIIGGAGDDKIIVGGSKNLIIYNWGEGDDNIGGLGGGTIRILGAGYSTMRGSYKEGSINYDDMIIEVGEVYTGNETVILPSNGRIYVNGNADGKKFKIEGEFLGSILPNGISVDGKKLLLSKDFEGDILNINDFTREINIIDATELLYGTKIFGNSSINLFNGSNYGDVYYCEYPNVSNDKVSGRVLESSAAVNVTPNSTINAAGGDDTIYGNGNKILYQYAQGDGNDIIYGFTYKDTLQITGGDFTSLESGDDVILTVGDGSITLKDAKNISLNIDGNYSGVTNLSVVGTKKADILIGGAGNDIFTGGSGKDVFVYGGGNDIITDYVAGQDRISLSSGKVNNSKLDDKDIILYTDEGSITVKNGKNKKITVTDGDGNATTEIFGRITYSEYKTAVSLSSIFKGTLNAADYDSSVVEIDATDAPKAVKIFGNDNDNVITGSKGNDTFYGGEGSDTFIYTAGNDVIADFEVGKDKVKLASGTVANYSVSGGKDAVLKVGNNKITLKNVGNEKFTVIGADNTEIIYGLDEGLNFNKDYLPKATAVTISADYESETFDATSYAKVVTIDASSRNNALEITGNAKNNKITGTTGDDTLSGGKGNDTLTGGEGSDTFIYTAGNDVITDFEIGKDKLKLASGTVANYSVSGGKDAVLKVGSNKITLKNVGNEKFTVIGADNTETVYGLDEGLNFNKDDLPKATAVTISADYESEIFDATAYAKVVTIDASNRNDALEITGNAKNNKIIGTTGDDTLRGGSGNDTLTGGDGADTFIYTAGKDVITDYTAGEDVIKLKGNLTVGYSTKKNDAVLKIGSGSLILKNAANAEITVVDSSGYASIFGAASDVILTKNAGANTIDEIIDSGNTITNLTQENSFGTNLILQDATQTYISKN